MTTDRATILLRAETFNFPPVSYANGSARLSGEDSWRRQLPEMLPGYLPEIARQLDAHEAQQRRADDFEAREAERDARRVEVEDLALIEEERREAAGSLARYRAAAPDRLEALARRQVELLEQLVAGLK